MKLEILNLGAGVQSSAIFCLIADRELPPVDVAIFADTQEEPRWVYEQLQRLREYPNGPPIVCVTAGKIGDDLEHGRNSTGQRFASIPAHTTYTEGQKGGLIRRQCTREYKIDPIIKYIRRVMLGLDVGQRLPTDIKLIQQFGFSTDEAHRAQRMRNNVKRNGLQWDAEFPLLREDVLMTRQDALNYVESKFGEWRSSRCVFCPMQQNAHWLEIKQHDTEGWNRAVEVDAALRTTGSVANRDVNENMYVHRSCYPLSVCGLDQGQKTFAFADDDGCDQGCFL